MGTTRATEFERRVAYSPFPSQERFHNLETRFKGFSGPVGSGKSLALCQEALKLAYINGGGLGLIGAPTYPMLRDVTRAIFLEVLEGNGVPYRFLKQENVVHLPEPGSEIVFRSLEHPESLRGKNLAWFGVDELTYCKPAAWTRLEARLREPTAVHLCGFAAWTPRGFDAVYERFVGPEKLSGYEAVFARPGENTALPDDFYDRLAASYDERFFKQEGLGEYLNVFQGRVYYAFDRTAHVSTTMFDPSTPLLWTLDFNVNPGCSLLAQWHGGDLHVLDELILPNSDSFDACEEFWARTERWQPLSRRSGPFTVYVFGDSSGGNRKTAGKTDWQIVDDFFRENRNSYYASRRVPASNPAVRDRVNTVNAALRNARGESRMVVDPKCRELLKDLEQVSWKTDPGGRTLNDIDDSDPMRTHTSDALGYLLWQEMKIAGAPTVGRTAIY